MIVSCSHSHSHQYSSLSGYLSLRKAFSTSCIQSVTSTQPTATDSLLGSDTQGTASTAKALFPWLNCHCHAQASFPHSGITGKAESQTRCCWPMDVCVNVYIYIYIYIQDHLTWSCMYQLGCHLQSGMFRVHARNIPEQSVSILACWVVLYVTNWPLALSWGVIKNEPYIMHFLKLYVLPLAPLSPWFPLCNGWRTIPKGQGFTVCGSSNTLLSTITYAVLSTPLAIQSDSVTC